MKYLSYYDIGNEEGRKFCLAATNKMDYICKAIVSNGEKVEIISASMSSSKGRFKGGKQEISDGITLKKFTAFKWGNLFQKLWTKIYSSLVLFFYLLFKVKRGEKVIVYHSLGYMKSISFAKFFKRFHMILEVEEIYGDVLGSKKDKKGELKFFKKADSYIFPTELLNQKINLEKKPYVIIHGTYNVEQQIVAKVNDGFIHCVYAGTFDSRKGVFDAVASAKHLDEKYYIHILGFGTEKEKNDLLEKIEEINDVSKCKVIYEGLLSGQDYIKFIQSCDIGLSTQSPNAAFNTTSFPSKVLSYLANGLRVVSIKIESLKTSAVNELLYYYEENNPEAIADAIKSIDVSISYDSRTKIEELNAKFTKEIKNLLELK